MVRCTARPQNLPYLHRKSKNSITRVTIHIFIGGIWRLHHYPRYKNLKHLKLPPYCPRSWSWSCRNREIGPSSSSVLKQKYMNFSVDSVINLVAKKFECISSHMHTCIHLLVNTTINMSDLYIGVGLSLIHI